MSLVTVNGSDALRGVLRLPRIGRWTGEFKVDSETAITGAAALVLGEGALTLKGTVARGGEIAALASVQLVAGANGLGKTASPKHYVSTAARVIVADLLRGAGEAISSTSDQTILSRSLPAWTTAAIPTGRVFKRLLATLGNVAWRALPDGSIWIGQETWPDSGLTADDVDVIEQDDEQAFAVLGLTLPTLLPGTLLFGQRVSYVEYSLEDSLRAKVWFEANGAGSDRFKSAFDGTVQGSIPDVDYAALYLASVISQTGGTVDVQPDDPRLPSMASVSLLTGLPWTAANSTAGGRVLVGWSGRNPSRPFALAFDSGTRIGLGGSIAIAGGGPGAARMGDSVTLTMTPADLANLASALLATGGFVSTGSPPSPPPNAVAFLGGTIVTGSELVEVGG